MATDPIGRSRREGRRADELLDLDLDHGPDDVRARCQACCRRAGGAAAAAARACSGDWALDGSDVAVAPSMLPRQRDEHEEDDVSGQDRPVSDEARRNGDAQKPRRLDRRGVAVLLGLLLLNFVIVSQVFERRTSRG